MSQNMDDMICQPGGGCSTDRENAEIRLILEGTASTTGAEFFRTLVKSLAAVLNTAGAWVTEYHPESNRLHALAFWFRNGFVHHYNYDLKGTPCEPVICERKLVHFPDRITDLFPDDPDLQPMAAVSYMGQPLFGDGDDVLGHLAVLDTKPMPARPENEALFRIFAARACAELRRMHAEEIARERESKLIRMVDSAMDAILELDDDLRITRANRAVQRTFGHSPDRLLGRPLSDLLAPHSISKLRSLIAELTRKPDGQQYFWIPGGLTGRRAGDATFPAEASVSRFETRGRSNYTLILRNIDAQVEADSQISRLTLETKYLRQEIDELNQFGEIIGDSPAVVRLLSDVRKVAPTDSTVLILGETGTGKELVARAIHRSSRRSDRPLVKVNCAAIPANLIESELFGHEKGAFTGALQKRDGRFALADTGTIFLDEIGELPVEMQAKLLRVLQEGEFEPVGSSVSKRVDVRVIAATNVDLKTAIAEKKFREDLYYRLCVFPLSVPPLRERGDDVVKIAEHFAISIAKEIGREIKPLSPKAIRALRSYTWPGNIRELRNIVERAVITTANGDLVFADLKPSRAEPADHSIAKPATDSNGVMTDSDLRELERGNLIRALDKCNGKVSGADGAASLLGLPPSTVASRLKALKIKR